MSAAAEVAGLRRLADLVVRSIRIPTERCDPEVSDELYGGFVHPWSTRNTDDLHLLVSKWTRGSDGRSTAYHISQFAGTL